MNRKITNIWHDELEKSGCRGPEIDKITKFAADMMQPYMMDCIKCQFVIGRCQYDCGEFFYKPKHCIKLLEKPEVSND